MSQVFRLSCRQTCLDIGESENSASNEDDPQFGCAAIQYAHRSKILLLITPEAETKLPDRNKIPGLVKQWTDIINTRLPQTIDSHPQKQWLIINLQNYSNDGHIDEDVINLRSNLQVNQIRNEKKADILFLITNQNYQTYLGHVGNEVVDPNRALGIIEVSYNDAPDCCHLLHTNLKDLFEALHRRITGGNPPDRQGCAFAGNLNK
ncbi:MAG: hypothetical protein IPK61_07255 [Saprospiraceae bacterium]|nr:hypothetical protein [Saprospiraceae bacterium]